uniref:DNA methylase n=1 Tax=Candidatus Kentrum sp. FW TaxID=2126338 RepID=A0A450TT12_9GAMM|nr:MAG: DNA methylase [Candidatus Kentron sp. FW]
MDDERLKNPDGRPDYFDEMLARIRDIRASEKRFYQKVRDLFALSSDYDTSPGDLVIDFFAHSGATLLVCEILNRRCFTLDIDQVYAEITIRRLEHYRASGRLGWQNNHPFEKEIPGTQPKKKTINESSKGRS